MTVVWDGSVTGQNRGMLCATAEQLVPTPPEVAPEFEAPRRLDSRARVLTVLSLATVPLSLGAILVAVNTRRRPKLTAQNVNNALYKLVQAGTVCVTPIDLQRSHRYGPRFVRGYAIVLED